MTPVEERLSTLLHEAAPASSGVSVEAVARKVRRRRTVGVALTTGVAVALIGAGATLAAGNGADQSLRPAATPSAPTPSSPTAKGLPAGAVTPTGCADILASLPHAAPDAAHLAPAAGDRPISELQAICIGEHATVDGNLTHPAWAWLTTRADIARYGWDGCTCNNRSRQVWVVAVAGPARTEGSPAAASREALGYSVVLDAATGQGTDATIGELMLRDGRTVRLAGGS